MHRTLLLAVIVALTLAIAGCGGGGGGGGSSDVVTPPPSSNSIAGTFTVPSLDLPQNQMMITSTGQVYVNGESPVASAIGAATTAATRPLGYYTRIGTCGPSGYITLDGGWTYGGVYHRITGSGSMNMSTHAITFTVTLLQNSRIVLQDAAIPGTLADSTPPPVPDFSNGGGDDIDLPPPVPL